MLLIIIYHFPFYESIPMLLSFYNETFKDILICGPKAYSNHYIMVVDFGPGHYGYECAAEAIRRYTTIYYIFSKYYNCNLDKQNVKQSRIKHFL